jgi:hypothetical protein
VIKTICFRIGLVLFAIVTTLAVLLIVDSAIGVLSNSPMYYRKSLFPNSPKTALGWVPHSESFRDRFVLEDGTVVYDVGYTFDEFGRRNLVQPDTPKTKTALFFGGSNTFGHGREDDQTIPQLFSQAHPDFATYNYAFQGYGPQQMLVKLQEGFAEDELIEAPGTAFYMYFNFHLNRVAATAMERRWSHGNHPFFDLDESGQLVDRGFFSTAEPFYNFLIWHYGNSVFFRRTGIDLPEVTAKHVQITCEIFKQSRELLAENQVRLLLYSPQPATSYTSVNNCLPEDLKISTVEPMAKNLHDYQFPVDLHLNPIGAKKIVEWLGQHLD